MKIKFEKLESTFVVGVSFSKNDKYTNLIFDLGQYSLAFTHKKASK